MAERAKELVRLSAKLEQLLDNEKKAFLAKAAEEAEARERLIQSGPKWYSDHVKQIGDADFVTALKTYLDESDNMFRQAESLRVTLAKHEIPKAKGMIAEAPGYGRMNNFTGSMYWHIILKDGSQLQVDRRTLANKFLRIKEENGS